MQSIFFKISKFNVVKVKQIKNYKTNKIINPKLNLPYSEEALQFALLPLLEFKGKKELVGFRIQGFHLFSCLRLFFANQTLELIKSVMQKTQPKLLKGLKWDEQQVEEDNEDKGDKEDKEGEDDYEERYSKICFYFT